MFTNKKDASKQSTTDTLIGKDSKIEGKVICKASLRIEGQVHGDVECAGDVTLGKEAIAYSIITARNVTNSGTVHGAIRSNGALTIASTGKMYGDITVGSLSIATGGIFEGMSKMDQALDLDVVPEIELESSNAKPKLHKIEGSNTSQQPSSVQASAK